MKIDAYGCVTMEKSGYPGDIGDSCAETSRYLILAPVEYDYAVKLENFVTGSGFIRHPDAPVRDDNGKSWREPDFTSDQGLYLVLAAFLKSFMLYALITEKMKSLGYQTAPGKWVSPALFFAMRGWWNMFALAQIVQIQFNRFPYRWHDGENGTESWGWFRKNFWRWTSSEGSTVSYMTTFVAFVFLHRINEARWAEKYFMKYHANYLTKSIAYYEAKDSNGNQEPNTEWFTDFYRKADSCFR